MKRHLNTIDDLFCIIITHHRKLLDSEPIRKRLSSMECHLQMPPSRMETSSMETVCRFCLLGQYLWLVLGSSAHVVLLGGYEIGSYSLALPTHLNSLYSSHSASGRSSKIPPNWLRYSYAQTLPHYLKVRRLFTNTYNIENA